ncbi:MAG: hypothetical protein AAF502_06380 [Bacteroidota bacterium]
MKNIKISALTLLLSIGFIIPGCVKDSCHGVVFEVYFNVEGVAVTNFIEYDGYGEGIPAIANDTIAYADLDKVFIDYQVDYLAFANPNRDWSFSLMSTATACSYIPGSAGSKTEELASMTITTLNDFDNDHLANSNINDLFDYHGSLWRDLDDPILLSNFLAGQTGLIEEEDLVLSIKKAPEIDQEFQVRVVLELSTGESFQITSEPIVITP